MDFKDYLVWRRYKILYLISIGFTPDDSENILSWFDSIKGKKQCALIKEYNPSFGDKTDEEIWEYMSSNMDKGLWDVASSIDDLGILNFDILFANYLPLVVKMLNIVMDEGGLHYFLDPNFLDIYSFLLINVDTIVDPKITLAKLEAVLLCTDKYRLVEWERDGMVFVVIIDYKKLKTLDAFPIIVDYNIKDTIFSDKEVFTKMDVLSSLYNAVVKRGYMDLTAEGIELTVIKDDEYTNKRYSLFYHLKKVSSTKIVELQDRKVKETHNPSIVMKMLKDKGVYGDKT